MRMLYGIVRIIFTIVIFLVAGNRIKKSQIQRKKTTIVAVLFLCIVFCTALNFLPAENAFVNFESPEQVFSYTASGEVLDTVYGEASSLIVYSTGRASYSHTLIPRSEKGYIIPSIWTVKKIIYSLQDFGSFSVYHVANTSDYVIIGFCVSTGGKWIVTDNKGSHFSSICANDIEGVQLENDTYLTYAYITNYSSDYYIVVNGEKIFLGSDDV